MIRVSQLTIAGLLLAATGCAGWGESPRTEIPRNSSPEARTARHPQDEAILHNNMAGLLFMRGDLDGAVKELREAIRLSPDIPAPHNNLGMVLHAQGHAEAAMEEFLKAIRLNPRHAAARSNLGFALFDRGDLGSAVQQWQTAVTLDPRSAGAWAGLALGLFAFGQVPQALESYRHALQLDPRYADVAYLQQARHWSAGAVGQAEAILQLIGALHEAPSQKVPL